MVYRIILFLLIVVVIIISFLLKYFFLANNTDDFKKVTIVTKDGFSIIGNYYYQPNSKFAGILVHMRPATKESWHRFALALKQEGFSVLAIDLRGHGESKLSPKGSVSYEDFNEEEEKLSINDIEAASVFLEKEGFFKDKQFYIGASIGANLGFQFLSENPSLKAAILFSPGINYRGIALERFKKDNLNKKILVISALDDQQAIEGSRLLKSWYSNVEYWEYSSGGHGTQLLENNQELAGKIINWLRTVMVE
ncbi:MAG: hypothetical protein KatS3mg097_180 [Candidatus Parcubacteria bacterium]|nr:MAG: hypothetical protein KatS3mg097_180 [Candidatus Parcubacteria bacterium]